MTRTLIVDDEAPARRMVRDALAALGRDVEIVRECINGPEAVAAIAEAASSGAPIELVFLDIQMPGLTGFEVLDALADQALPLPRVVFSTAFDQFAVQAFEVAAVDYLMKPFTQARFAEAVDRALAAEPQVDRVVEVVRESQSYAERLLVEHGGVFVPVAVADLVWVEAAGDYARLHTRSATGDTRAYLASQGIGALEARLDPARFARVHRSTLLALDAIRSLERDNSGGFTVRLVDGATVRVSRTYADTVRRLMA